MPTGAGKTFTAVDALAEVLAVGRPVLWIAHSSELLDGAQKTLLARYPELARGPWGNDSGIGRIEGRRKEFGARVCLGSVQTLVALEQRALLQHLETLDAPPIVVWDEFHHALGATWRKVLVRLEERGIPVLGLSATPHRSNPEDTLRLRRAFPRALFRIGMQELVDARVLARPKLVRVTVDGPRLAWTNAERSHLASKHDVPQSLLKRLAAQAIRNKKILATYRSLATDGATHEGGAMHRVRKCLIFCCTIDHARHLAQLFQRSGVAAKDVCGKATDAENRAAIEAFKDPNSGLDVLTSVLLLTEGVDLPLCDTVMLARPTQSPILLQQMMGRAMRGPEVNGTESCLIVDFVDNFENMHDVSASNVAFVRSLFETGAGAAGPNTLQALFAALDASTIRRGRAPTSPRTPEQRRAAERAFASLLALRDYIWRHYGEDVDPEVFAEDVSDLIQWFDATSGVHRSFVVPRAERDTFERSIHVLSDAAGQLAPEARTPIREAALARQIFDEHFDEKTKIEEEEYVAAATAAIRARPGELDVQRIHLDEALAQLQSTGIAAGALAQPDHEQRYGSGVLALAQRVTVVPSVSGARRGDDGFVVTAEVRAAWADRPARDVLHDRGLFSFCMSAADLSPGDVAARATAQGARRVRLVFPEAFTFTP
jgi:superfamily II DNA or RNA helicase